MNIYQLDRFVFFAIPIGAMILLSGSYVNTNVISLNPAVLTICSNKTLFASLTSIFYINFYTKYIKTCENDAPYFSNFLRL